LLQHQEPGMIKCCMVTRWIRWYISY